MELAIGSGLMRDLAEAKGALARHGVVIVRGIETELEPAIMAGAKSSMASSPGRLSKIDDDELDKLFDKLRRTALKSVEELKELYVRLLANLGTESISDLSRELEGIGELFKWERIKQSIDPVNAKLAEKGFGPVVLEGPRELSDGFEVELEQRWPPAFKRFKNLVDEAAKTLAETEQPRRSERRAKKAPAKE